MHTYIVTQKTCRYIFDNNLVNSLPNLR